MHRSALFARNASNHLKPSVLLKGCSACCFVWLLGVPSCPGLHRGPIPSLVMLMWAPHAGLQGAHLPAPDGVDPGDVWGFARMDARLWGLQQQPPEEAGNQQQHSPEQLQELLHKQQVCPVGCHLRHCGLLCGVVPGVWLAVLHTCASLIRRISSDAQSQASICANDLSP